MIVAKRPAGKDVALAAIRRGKQGATTVKLGEQATHFEETMLFWRRPA
jgi:hypothetical protein